MMVNRRIVIIALAIVGIMACFSSFSYDRSESCGILWKVPLSGSRLAEWTPEKMTLHRYTDPVAGILYLPPVHFKWVTGAEKHILRVFDSATRGEVGNRIVLDVGTNDGFYSLVSAARKFPVHAFEVQQSCVEVAEAVWRFNNVHEFIHLHRNAATDVSGQWLSIPIVEGCSGVLTVQKLESSSLSKFKEIQTVHLDSIVGAQPVAFLKVDVEGMEAKVILGARRLFQERQIEVAAVESHHWRKGNAVQSMEQVSFVYDYGYTIKCLMHTASHHPDGGAGPTSIVDHTWRSKKEWMSAAEALTANYKGDTRFQCVDLLFEKSQKV